MAIIPQQTLFVWNEIENLGDLERLKLVIENMPDEELMKKLEKERGKKGRDDYPIRPLWNTVFAGIVFQHPSIESLRRELNRNAQLRHTCGIYNGAVAPPWVYTGFLKKLIKHQKEIEKIFLELVSRLEELLPDFGKSLAIDGKPIESLAKRHNKKQKEDGRRDIDANKGIKVYNGKREDGTLWEKVKEWFGYKLHLIVDADYELPVAFEVTKATASEQVEAHKLLDKMKTEQPEILKKCETFTGDKGYDGEELIARLWDEYKIKPIIDIRNCWADKNEIKMFEGRKNIIGYDNQGEIYCYCPQSGERRMMANKGFEEKRESLKIGCPAKAYGLTCKGKEKCPYKSGLRIKLSEDKRRFTPIARSTYKWKRLYKKRTAVERVNSRLDASFGFERHFIRGLKKMKLRCSLAMIVMLAMAVGRIKQKQEDKIRSLVKTA